ncbi:hypothetical protein [Paraburkholderia kururiensis]|uniref:hypothetical protein n=1 Tax=Paraburkholderia kururiensis TaxID=984307 RepID=UPI0005A9B3FD|nr:hypothetical protein [Paraburkholderia kururiensis]
MQQMDPIETHIQTVWSFVRLAMLKRVLHEVVPDTQLDLWRIMMGASLDYGLIEWCKIFGSRADDTHWTKVVPDNQRDAFRTGLYAAVGKTPDEWDAYHTEMKEYRDKYAAHIDFSGKAANFPDFDPALAASYHYYATFLYPEWSGKHPGTHYPADMQAFAADYRQQLLDVANAAAQATKQFEPGK